MRCRVRTVASRWKSIQPPLSFGSWELAVLAVVESFRLMSPNAVHVKNSTIHSASVYEHMAFVPAAAVPV